jgi:hypothetical protein
VSDPQTPRPGPPPEGFRPGPPPPGAVRPGPPASSPAGPGGFRPGPPPPGDHRPAPDVAQDGGEAGGQERVVTETGHPAVDAVLQSLANAARLAPAEQIAEYEAAHQVLQETLAGIDG